MARTGFAASDYARLLRALLPPGKAWTRDTSSTLYDVLESLADELARVDQRGWDLIEERLPGTATELLNEHEDDLNLPDTCFANPRTVAQRQTIAQREYVLKGRLDKAFYILRASQRSFTITIQEFDHPLSQKFELAAYAETDEYYDIFDWIAEIHLDMKVNKIYARAGNARCGDAIIRVPIAEYLHCFLKKWKPGHTRVVTKIYGPGPAFSSAFSDAFDRVELWVYNDNLSWDRQGAFDRSFDASFDTNLGGAFNGYEFGPGFHRRIGGAFSNAFSSAFEQPLAIVPEHHGGFSRDEFAAGFDIN